MKTSTFLRLVFWFFFIQAILELFLGTDDMATLIRFWGSLTIAAVTFCTFVIIKSLSYVHSPLAMLFSREQLETAIREAETEKQKP